MKEISVSTTYFARPGKENTERTFHLAASRADELNIDTILVATTSGASGALAASMFKDQRLIVVSHADGFKGPNTQELTPQNRSVIESSGATILTCQHAFGGVNRAVRKQLGTTVTDEIIANTLRIFGEGMKVVIEIALMAADAGLVKSGEPLISIAGTGHGADFAVVLLPVNTYTFFDIKVVETICRPAPQHPLLKD